MCSILNIHFQVVEDGGRPKIQVEHKGEIKKFFPEEVRPFHLILVVPIQPRAHGPLGTEKGDNQRLLYSVAARISYLFLQDCSQTLFFQHKLDFKKKKKKKKQRKRK